MTVIITKSVGGAAGRDYASLEAWKASIPLDLVAADEVHVAELYNDNEFTLTSHLNFRVFTTDEARYIKIKAADGESFKDHNSVRDHPLRYEPKNGVAIRLSNGANTAIAYRGFLHLENLQIKGSVHSNYDFSKPNIDNCLIVFSGGVNSGGALSCLTNHALRAVVKNSVFINEYDSARYGVTIISGRGVKFQNCSFLVANSSGNGILLSEYYGVSEFQNCLFALGANGRISRHGRVNIFKNCASDADFSSAPNSISTNCLSNLNSSSFFEINATAHNAQDLRIKRDSLTVGRGLTIDAVADDISGKIRVIPYDIGHWQQAVAGAFPDGWLKKVKISAIAAKTSGSHVDFPLLLTETTLPADIFTSAINGGGDIRFSSDAEGANQLACEIVYFISGNSTAQIWVKVPVWAASSNIFIWWGKSGATQPLPSSVFGSQSVWSEYELVTHKGINDSTKKHRLVFPDGQPGDAYNGYDECINIDTAGKGQRAGTSLPLTKPYSISVYIKPNGYGALYGQIFSPRKEGTSQAKELSVFIQGNKLSTQTSYTTNRTGIKTGNFVSGNKYHVYAEIDKNDSTKLYLNGVEQTEGYVDYWLMSAGIGGGGYYAKKKGYFKGEIHNIWARNGILSSDRILTESNNQNDPAGFVTVGVVVEIGGTELTLTIDDVSCSFVVGTVNLEVVSHLVIDDVSLIFDIENIDLSQRHYLNVDDISCSLLLENLTLSQTLKLQIDNLSCSFQIEDSQLNTIYLLTIDNASCLFVADPASLKFTAGIWRHQPKTNVNWIIQ